MQIDPSARCPDSFRVCTFCGGNPEGSIYITKGVSVTPRGEIWGGPHFVCRDHFVNLLVDKEFVVVSYGIPN